MTPEQIEAGGSEVVIVDDESQRSGAGAPSDETGRGTLARLDLQRRHPVGRPTTATWRRTPPSNGYRIYVVEPSQGQILRYEQTLDRQRLHAVRLTSSPRATRSQNFRQLYIDFDVWALDDEGRPEVQERSLRRRLHDRRPARRLRPTARPRLRARVRHRERRGRRSPLPLRLGLGPPRRVRQGDRRLSRAVGARPRRSVHGGHARLLRRPEDEAEDPKPWSG